MSHWRGAIVAGLFLVVIGQTISVAHTADLSLHSDGGLCQICQAIGHAAAPPAPAAAPAEANLIGVAFDVAAIVSVALRPIHSSHSPRAPPRSL